MRRMSESEGLFVVFESNEIKKLKRTVCLLTNYKVQVQLNTVRDININKKT